MGRQTNRIFLSMITVLILFVAACSKDPSSNEGDSDNKGRVAISMFMGDSGLPHPEGVDPENNKFINIVKEQAGVDLKLEVPSYADFPTRFNLMLASGKMPDLVQTYLVDETYRAARQGAFIDLKEYYDNSPQVQKYITKEMMEFAKDPVTGKYWRIPMAWEAGPQGSGVNMMRGELIDKYNNGIWPKSVEEWIEFFKVVKKEIPDAVIMSNAASGDNVFTGGGSVIYFWYGAVPYGWRIQDGEIIPNVLLPEFREATLVMKDLYDQGLLDPEFATTDDSRYNEKVINNTVLLQVNSADQIAPGAVYYKTEKSLPPHAKEVKWLFAPPLKEYPKVLKDKKYAEPKMGLPIITHGLYISSSSKHPDEAWKVIEAFASDELYESIFWGYEGEGVTYNTVDGKRVPTDKIGPGTEDYWSLHLALVFGFLEGQDAKVASHRLALGDKYTDEVYNSIYAMDQIARENGIGELPGYVAPDEAVLKASEARLAINSFTVEAIMGKITMEQSDQRVKQWEAQFRDVIYGPMQKYLDENKEMLIRQGVKHAGW